MPSVQSGRSGIIPRYLCHYQDCTNRINCPAVHAWDGFKGTLKVNFKKNSASSFGKALCKNRICIQTCDEKEAVKMLEVVDAMLVTYSIRQREAEGASSGL